MRDIAFLIIALALAIVCWIVVVTISRSIRKDKINKQVSVSPSIWSEEIEESNVGSDDIDEKRYRGITLTLGDLKVKLDEVIVRKNGIFVVVKKNRAGHIHGSEGDEWWIQRRYDTEWKLIEKSFRNPIKEVKLHIYPLSQKMHEIFDCYAWIQGIVVFSHPRVNLSVETSDVPVLTPEKLDDYLHSFKPRKTIPVQQLTRIQDWLLLEEEKSKISETNTVVEVQEKESAKGLPKLSENERTHYYSIVKQVAEQIGYDVPYTYKENTSIVIRKGNEDLVYTKMSADGYNISTYRANETFVQEIIFILLKKLGFSPDKYFAQEIINFIEMDSYDREQIIGVRGVLKYSGSRRYGYLSIQLELTTEVELVNQR